MIYNLILQRGKKRNCCTHLLQINFDLLDTLVKLFEINLKLNFNYQKLKICFMSKCVDLPPIICAANADRFSGNFYNCCCRFWCNRCSTRSATSDTKTSGKCRNRRVKGGISTSKYLCGRLRLRTIDTTLGIKITSSCF